VPRLAENDSDDCLASCYPEPPSAHSYCSTRRLGTKRRMLLLQLQPVSTGLLPSGLPIVCVHKFRALAWRATSGRGWGVTDRIRYRTRQNNNRLPILTKSADVRANATAVRYGDVSLD